MIAPEGKSLLRARITADAPTGDTSIDIELERTNLHPRAASNLLVTVPIGLRITR